MNKEFGSKGRLAASEFYGLKRRDAFVLVVGQKRLVGFEIRDAIDVQRDQLMDRLREFGVLLEISEFQFDDVLGFEKLDCWDIEEVFGEFDGGIELPIDESDLGVFVLVSEGIFFVFWGEVIGRDDTDSLAGGIFRRWQRHGHPVGYRGRRRGQSGLSLRPLVRDQSGAIRFVRRTEPTGPTG